MQPNFISPALLLRGYLDDEHRKINQDITTNQFSRELTAQQNQLTSQPDTSAIGSLAKDSTAVGSTAAAQSAIQDSDNSDQTGANVYLTNAALLEKALAQLKLPAEARKAIKAAEDAQGRISLKSLSQILGQYQPATGTLGEGQVSAEDVQGILSSLQCGSSTASVGAGAVAGAKQQGSYSLGEFRQVVDSIARQAATTGSKTGTSISAAKAKLATGSSAGSTTTPGGASTTESTGTQSNCRPSNVIPSFVEDDSVGNKDKKTTSHEAQTQDVKEPAESTGQASRTANKAETDESTRQHASQAATVSQSTQIVEGGIRQSEWVSSSHKVSSDKTLSTDTASDSDTGGTASPDAVSLLAQMAAQAASAPSEGAGGQSQVPGDPMGEVGKQTAAAVAGSGSSMANGVAGDKKSSSSFASAGIGSASGSTPPGTSITPPQQTGGNSLESRGQGGGFSQSSSSSSERSSGAAGAEHFLWTSTKTAQNESAASSLNQGVSTETLMNSPLLREEVQKNGIVTGEISLSKTAQSAGSAATDNSPGASQEVQTAVPSDLNTSESLKQSKESTVKAAESRKESPTGTDGFKPTLSSVDLGGSRADNSLSGLSALRTVSSLSTTPQASSAGQLNMSASSWPSDLAEQVQALYQRKDASNLTLDLEPAGMGRLTLRVSAKKQEVTAYVSADNQQVGDLLSRNSTVLREHLQSQGLTLTNLFVDVRQGQDGNSNSYFQSGNSQRERSGATKASQSGSSQKIPSSSVRMDRYSERLINLVA